VRRVVGRRLKNLRIRGFEKVFGEASATPENMATVAAGYEKMASALRDTGPSAAPANAMTSDQLGTKYGAPPSVLAGVPSDGSRLVVVNVTHPDFWSRKELTWAAGHEMAHLELGFKDEMINGYKAYKFGEPEERSSFDALPGQQRLVNPDHLMQEAY